MTAGVELLTIDEWLMDTLSADEDLAEIVGDRIYPDTMKGSEYPAIIYQDQSNRDVYVIGANRLWVEALYLIRVVVRGASYFPASDAAVRIDALLHKTRTATSSGNIFSSVRESPFRDKEVDGGKEFSYLGGFYRIRAD